MNYNSICGLSGPIKLVLHSSNSNMHDHLVHGSTYLTYQLVAQELWLHKQTSPSGFALWIGSFTAIIPGHPVDNYYIQVVMHLKLDIPSVNNKSLSYM